MSSMAATVPALWVRTGLCATPGTSVMSPPRLWRLTQARTAGKSSAATSRSLARGRMIVKMARSQPRCSGGMSSSSPMYCSRSTGIPAPSAMSWRRWSASWGMLPACFDTRSSSASAGEWPSARRIFSPPGFRDPGRAGRDDLVFSRLLSQGNPQQLQVATGAGQYLTEGLQPGSHGDAVCLNLALLLLGSLDPLTDQGCLVVTRGRERVERVALRLFRFPSRVCALCRSSLAWASSRRTSSS